MLSDPILRQLTVGEAMHEGIVKCSPSACLDEVAAALAEYGIHCVVAIDEGPPGEDDDRLWGVVSDVDLMRGIASQMDLDAGNLAELDVATAAPEDSLEDAARTMARRGVAHLVVVAEGRPVGVISTLDLCRAAARGSKHGEWYRPVAATYAAHPSLTAATLTRWSGGSDSRTRLSQLAP